VVLRSVTQWAPLLQLQSVLHPMLLCIAENIVPPIEDRTVVDEVVAVHIIVNTTNHVAFGDGTIQTLVAAMLPIRILLRVAMYVFILDCMYFLSSSSLLSKFVSFLCFP
jgi:hypothetical protein